jgi:hypothetical protein
MLVFEAIAEKRIAEALERGELSGLPGEGRPLELDDDALVPEELRLACRILKNAGFVPPEVEQIRSIRELQHLIPTLDDDAERRRLMLRLDLLVAQTAAGRRHGGLHLDERYFDRAAARLAHSPRRM